ncbi:DUF5819 family protein [Streptomyces sp. NPDC052492]|uniref:DUF5819 family protein n=1 Tax=Streptomyces sp. NPDC052492 TaxID=3365691 RepID=UPI0037D4CB17
MLSGAEVTDVKDTRQAGAASAVQDGGGGPVDSLRYAGPPRPLNAATGIAVALCLAVTLVHVLLVFLYVAPPNVMSQAYSHQVNAWVRPYFEQNWRLFAPNPQSANRQISARVSSTAPDGTTQVSGWIDLTAADDAAVKHSVFPSHTAQNMLRQAWNAYLKTHGTDNRPHSERALMIEKYLRNIAAERVAAQRDGTFDSIQLRVVSRPVAAPRAGGANPPATTAPARTETRYLPWWKVVSHGTD